MSPTDADDGSVPVGEWVDVPRGKILAMDTYKDREGVLRSSYDHSVVCWHWGPRHCGRRGIKPNEIVYDPETKAPWCPECWPVRQDFYAMKAQQEAIIDSIPEGLKGTGQ